MNANPRNLSLRLKGDKATRLAEFERRTGILGTTLMEELLEAALVQFARGERITFPVEIKSLEEVALVAEKPATFKTKTKAS